MNDEGCLGTHGNEVDCNGRRKNKVNVTAPYFTSDNYMY